MATTGVLSVRVDAGLKERAESVVRSSGMTIAEVFKRTLEDIVAQGTVPYASSVESDQGRAWSDFMAFRAGLANTGSMASLTREDVRAMIAERYE